MLKPLHRYATASVGHGLCNLLFPHREIIVGFNPKELDKTLKLPEIVLHRSASQTPSIFGVQGTGCQRSLCVAILYCVSFVKDHTIPVKTEAADFESPSQVRATELGNENLICRNDNIVFS